MQRRRLVVVVVAGVQLAAVAAACGGDDTNQPSDASADGTLDQQSGDVIAPSDAGDASDTGLPQPCATLDSSCLGDADVPDGWALVGFVDGVHGCPTNFTQTQLVADAQAASGSCVCAACETKGTYDCNGAATIETGTNCSSSAQVEAGVCVTSTQSQIAGLPPSIGGNPTCTVANDAGSGVVDTTAVTVCTPTQCAADYCHLPDAGLRTCIVSDGDRACPPGFTQGGVAGFGATLGCSCGACTITGNPQCSGTVEMYSSNDCDAGKATLTANGQCAAIFGSIHSYRYVSDAAPVPSCAPSSSTPGTASVGLVGAKTICCH